MHGSWRFLLVLALFAASIPFWPLQPPQPVAEEAATPWGASYFPNIPLLTQDGEKVHFFDDLIRDKVVAINFIFTGCSDSCPVETARLRQVQKILGDRVGKDIFLYSISIDPYNDTPATLKTLCRKVRHRTWLDAADRRTRRYRATAPQPGAVDRWPGKRPLQRPQPELDHR